MVVGVHIHADTGFFLWAYAISYAFACVYFGIVLVAMGVLRPAPQLEPGLLLSWVKVAMPLGITFIITTVYFKVDVPDPAALPAVQRGGVLHVRVQAVRVAALHSRSR